MTIITLLSISNVILPSSSNRRALYPFPIPVHNKSDKKYKLLFANMCSDKLLFFEIMSVLLRSQLNAKISLSFKRDFENDHSKLRILVDSCLENQRIWRFVLISTISMTLLRSWTVYEDPVPGIRVCVRQVSPFIPHSYSDASLPVSVFHIDVENTGEGSVLL